MADTAKFTQNDKILRHMNDVGWIDPMTALEQYGIMRLASRISDLKKEGYAIVKDVVKKNNRYGEPIHYARYKLLEESDYVKEGAENGRQENVHEESNR